MGETKGDGSVDDMLFAMIAFFFFYFSLIPASTKEGGDGKSCGDRSLGLLDRQPNLMSPRL